jgi:hypothetical protein
VAALLFIVRPSWRLSFAVAISAVVVLFVLTFVQPPIWLRIVLDLALLMGVVQAWRTSGQRQPSGQWTVVTDY